MRVGLTEAEAAERRGARPQGAGAHGGGARETLLQTTPVASTHTEPALHPVSAYISLQIRRSLQPFSIRPYRQLARERGAGTDEKRRQPRGSLAAQQCNQRSRKGARMLLNL